jgi:polysaccharide export outer membrane protein
MKRLFAVLVFVLGTLVSASGFAQSIGPDGRVLPAYSGRSGPPPSVKPPPPVVTPPPPTPPAPKPSAAAHPAAAPVTPATPVAPATAPVAPVATPAAVKPVTPVGLSATSSSPQSVASTESNAIKPSSEGRLSAVATVDSRTSVELSQFTLGAADVIRVNVWKNADLSQTVTVGPDGFVSLPLLGDVHAAGMTANQLAQTLSSRLTTYVVSAQVTVSVVEIRSRQVYVMGQVGKPGGYPLIAPITVLQLIAQAGGLTTFANRKGIFVLRGTKGNVQRIKFNYVSAIQSDSGQNIDLQPGDTVIVP